ncbi:MAG: chemotaxis protein CheC [Desulfobacteraceae bacterium]
MNTLTEERRDALTELLNIGFGRSIASMADLVGFFIQISVPSVRIVHPHDIVDVLQQSDVDRDEVTLIQQAFRGEFSGEAVLALPGKAGWVLTRMLDIDCGFHPDMAPDKLQLEVLLELGNIVIGACLGKFAEILDCTLSFNPPQVFLDNIHLDRLKQAVSLSENEALFVVTRFHLERQEVTGYMFIFIGSDCQDSLFRAVDRFLSNLS